MLLRHGLGYGVDEIAELTNTPRGTVKDRLVAGKKQLRKWLREELTTRGMTPNAAAARVRSGDASEPQSASATSGEPGAVRSLEDSDGD
jgi:hypothetical protein